MAEARDTVGQRVPATTPARAGATAPAPAASAPGPAASAPATVRVAVPGDALIVAALTLQCALHRGGAREPGFLERFARAWGADPAAHPCWLAEREGQHAGYLLGALLRPLPWPGDGGDGGDGGDRGDRGDRGDGGAARAGYLLVEQFFVRPDVRGLRVGEHLLAAARDWARAEGLAAMQMRPGPHTRSLCERVGLVETGDLMELRLEADR